MIVSIRCSKRFKDNGNIDPLTAVNNIIALLSQGHGPTSLLVDGERHPHADLLEDAGALLWNGGTIGGATASGVVGTLTTIVGDAAGSDLDSKELAAIM